MEVLKNKQYITYDNTSRYTHFPVYYHTIDNKYIGGMTAYLKDTTGYTTYTTQQFDTYDTIALRFYNTPTYYWIICSFNHIQDPYSPITPGTKLKIPTISSLSYEE